VTGYTGPKLEVVEEFLRAAEALANGRVRYAQQFMLAKGRGKDVTDGFAREVAVEVTQSEVTMLEALLEVARMRLHG